MAHHPRAAQIIEDAVRGEVSLAGILRMRVVTASDEQIALAILDALDRQGLVVAAREAPPG